MAISESAARTTQRIASLAEAGGTATSTYGLAAERSAPGRIPSVVPPSAFAPRQAASIAPPRPPHTRTARPAPAPGRPPPPRGLRVAGSYDRDIAPERRPGVGRPSTAARPSADYEVHELARHHDRLHDLAPVQPRAQPLRGPRVLLELLAARRPPAPSAGRSACRSAARSAGSRRCQQRRVGLRPGLLPHPLAGHPLVDLGAEVRREGEHERSRRGQREADVRRDRRSSRSAVELVDELDHRGDRGVGGEALARSRVTLSIAQCALRTRSLGSPWGSVGPARAPRRRPATAARGSGGGPRSPRRTSRRPRPGGRRRGCSSARCPRRSARRSRSGETTLPLDLDIFAPSRVTIPWVNRRVEGLLDVEQLQVRQRLDEEARVHQVQDRVLDAADVLVDRHPAPHAPRGPTAASSLCASQ